MKTKQKCGMSLIQRLEIRTKGSVSLECIYRECGDRECCDQCSFSLAFSDEGFLHALIQNVELSIKTQLIKLPNGGIMVQMIIRVVIRHDVVCQ